MKNLLQDSRLLICVFIIFLVFILDMVYNFYPSQLDMQNKTMVLTIFNAAALIPALWYVLRSILEKDNATESNGQ